jgi:Zn-dependent protease with chaperone function
MVQKLHPGLSGEHFAHPLDRSGMQNLMGYLAKSVAKNLIEQFQDDTEEEFYLFNLADNTRLSESQGGSVYRHVPELADIFGIPTPHLFLDTNPELKTYALGGSNPTVVLSSGLVDTFPESLLRVAVAHELGHIICRHTFYRMLAENFDHLSNIVAFIPYLGPIFTVGIQLPLFDWYRRSELSADRAALLGTQDLEAVKDYILRLAGGASRLGDELSVLGFAAQADELQERLKAKREANIQDRIGFLFSGFMLQHAMNTHPWPAVRLQEISRWAESEQYALLLAGDYDAAVAAAPATADTGFAAPVGEDMMDYVKEIARTAGNAVKSGMKGLVKSPQKLIWRKEKEPKQSD